MMVSCSRFGWLSVVTAIVVACGSEQGGPLDADPNGDASADGATSSSGQAPDDAAIHADAARGDASTPSADGSVETLDLPPENAGFDYQLGDAYPPPVGVGIVVRDHGAAPMNGLYNICYINGFQTQAEARTFWFEQHADLILHEGGAPVEDPNWEGEYFLDVSTESKRAALLAIERPWLQECADKGFDAVEIDNLDTYTRVDGLLREDDAVAFVRLLAEQAHALGLAIAQKNATDLSPRKNELGTDFVIAESCSVYDECAAYTEHYGTHVLMVEYEREAFERGCQGFPGHSIVLRDQELVGPSDADYLYDGC